MTRRIWRIFRRRKMQSAEAVFGTKFVEVGAEERRITGRETGHAVVAHRIHDGKRERGINRQCGAITDVIGERKWIGAGEYGFAEARQAQASIARHAIGTGEGRMRLAFHDAYERLRQAAA